MEFPQKHYLCNMSEFGNRVKKGVERREKDKTRSEKLASYFFDLSKVTYTVLVVGLLVNVIQEQNFTNIVLDVTVVVGVLLSIVFAKVGDNILRR